MSASEIRGCSWAYGASSPKIIGLWGQIPWGNGVSWGQVPKIMGSIGQIPWHYGVCGVAAQCSG